MYFIHVKV